MDECSEPAAFRAEFPDIHGSGVPKKGIRLIQGYQTLNKVVYTLFSGAYTIWGSVLVSPFLGKLPHASAVLRVPWAWKLSRHPQSTDAANPSARKSLCAHMRHVQDLGPLSLAQASSLTLHGAFQNTSSSAGKQHLYCPEASPPV